MRRGKSWFSLAAMAACAGTCIAGATPAVASTAAASPAVAGTAVTRPAVTRPAVARPAVARPASAARPAAGRPAARPARRTVTYRGVSLRVPRSWPVVNLARHPRACPRLDVHAVYLGSPGPDPACPASIPQGKTAAVVLQPVSRTSPDLRQATRATVIGGRAARTNPDAGVTHTIIDILPSAQVEISLSYGASAGIARYIESSITVTGADRTVRALRPAAIRRAAPQGVVKGPGFDTCAAPSAGTMHSWLHSPYRAVGIYIGGVNRACAQSNLTSRWLRTIQGEGWHYFPMYVGLQAPCVAGFGDATISKGSAAAEGKAAADDAVTQAGDLGIPTGTPIIFDMEAYRGGCSSTVTTFLSAWDSELHARDYVAGIYESFSNIGDLIAAAGQMTEPDVIHYADWDGQATTTSSYMPANRWTSHQRIHQYQGGHNESWGGQTLNIDNDQLDVALGGAAVSPPPPAASARQPGFRIAVAINSNGSAEWFARAASRTIRHNYQHPVGSATWSATRAVGNSPADVASNPAVTADASGILTLFARTSAGQVVHAWQQPGAPNDWHWGGPVGANRLPGRAADDPAAIQTSDGKVAVLVTLASGRVVTTRQRAPNDNTGWTAWASLGGHCASTPVPVRSGSRALEVLCTTAGGDLAADRMSGGAWSGWRTVPGQPARLTGTPSAVAAGGGVEVLAASRPGRLEYAWQGSGAASAGGGWAWGSSPDPGKIRNSPSATAWPGGKVGVFAQQANGQLGYAVQEGTGAAGWSGWTGLGNHLLGSPTAWTNTTGNPEAAILTSGRSIAVSTDDGGAWSPWTSLGGGY